MSGVVLHIGLPKTGTTTLQKAVFPHLPGVAYAGKRIPGYGFATQSLGEAVAATISAAVAVKWMVGYLNRRGGGVFGWYRIAAALVAAVMIATNFLNLGQG